MFDGAVQWAIQAERTTFWKPPRRPAVKVESPRESVVAMRKGGAASITAAARKWTEERESPFLIMTCHLRHSCRDDAHLQKLQNLGMTPADESKLQAMRDCILKVATNNSR